MRYAAIAAVMSGHISCGGGSHPSSTRRLDVASVYELLERGEVASVIRAVQPVCRDSKHPDRSRACVLLADAIALQTDATEEETSRAYRQACELGELRACTATAFADRSESRLTTLCERQREPIACALIGKDATAAAQACEGNSDGFSCFVAAMARGPSASAYLEQACARGVAAACLAKRSFGTPEAIAVDDACKRGGRFACAFAVQADPIATTRLCDAGNGYACHALAVAAGTSGSQGQARAYELYGKACRANVIASCNAQARMQQDGLGVTKNEGFAAATYVRLCRRGWLLNRTQPWRMVGEEVADACRNACFVLREGIGVQAQPAKADTMCQLACLSGDIELCEKQAQSPP